ncbi:heme-binding protein [Novosphingobium sp. KCTC 2891]|uniref:GlcG/HbpS family heme-binding protein n=1 Tax=Novosphingobium sp. KCTC 2891 TaxID=2989730 RepID=UPI0022218567|nr:heme-binding protein [Novosphingobium sp. KCTC 2891]MCW1384949.1 heme-binding protein [Novosphingobium sp. KCTC 2891]
MQKRSRLGASGLIRHVTLSCALLIAPPATAQAPVAQANGYGAPITALAALALVERGMVLSRAKGLNMAIAVVEPTGELVAFVRMDDVPYASIHIAQQKARAAARFRMATAQLEERVLSGRTTLLSSDEVIAVGGGVPILIDGKVVGALGVSGASAAEDATIAEAIVRLR